MSSRTAAAARWVGVALVGVCAAVVVSRLDVDLGAWARWVEALRGAGWRGQLMFAAVYVAATVLMVPASWLMGAAGFLYGPVWGTIFAGALSTTGATVSFGLARTVLRERLEAALAGPRVKALDRAVAAGGLRLVTLVRLPPVSPYNVVSYAMGLTGVRTRDFVVGTAVGGSVPVVLWSYVGSTVADLTALMAGEVQGPVWVRWVGLGVTLVATIWVSRFARQVVARAIAES